MKKKGLLLGILIWTGVFAQDPAVYVDNTIAGEDTPVHISGLLLEEQATLVLERPGQTSLAFEKKANDLGSIDFKISGLHIQKAGDYKMVMQSPYRSGYYFGDNFHIYPGVVSAFRSQIELGEVSVPADGLSGANFEIVLRDAYDNPIPEKKVQIISSRNSDKIVFGSVSNKEGVVKGSVLSNEPGVSTLSVITGDIVLFEKPEVVFFLSDGEIPNIGFGDFSLGEFLKAQVFSGDAFGDPSYFTIEELPDTVLAGDVVTLHLEVKDEVGLLVKNYIGKVRFSCTTDNLARLPVDYQYELDDQGSHRFSLAVQFNTPGEHILEVNDLRNFRIAGQKQIIVLPADGGIDPTDGNTGIRITSPRPGTFKDSRITLKGKAFGFTSVKIIDGPTLLVENLTIDQSTGDFSFDTPMLDDGTHRFQVMSMDEQIKSEELLIRIDRTPPTVLAVEIDPPDDLDPGQDFMLKITSTETILRAHCSYLGDVVELNNAGRFFLAELTAPMECGSYKIGCIIADLMENEFSEDEAATINVCETGFDTDGDGLLDKNEFGDEDDDGVENKFESNIVDSTGDGIMDQQDPYNDSDMGGAHNWKESKEDETDPLNPDDDIVLNVAPLAVTNFSAEPGEGKVTLFWSPAIDDKEIKNYRIKFGKSADLLDQENTTPDNRTKWYIDNLQAGMKYYFQVYALDIDGLESSPSRVVEGSPFGGDLINGNGQLEKSGPGEMDVSFWGLLFILLAGSGVIVADRMRG